MAFLEQKVCDLIRPRILPTFATRAVTPEQAATAQRHYHDGVLCGAERH